MVARYIKCVVPRVKTISPHPCSCQKIIASGLTVVSSGECKLLTDRQIDRWTSSLLKAVYTRVFDFMWRVCFASLFFVDTTRKGFPNCSCWRAAWGGSTAARVSGLGAAATAADLRPTRDRQGSSPRWTTTATGISWARESQAGGGTWETVDGVGGAREGTSTSADTATEWQHRSTAASGQLNHGRL